MCIKTKFFTILALLLMAVMGATAQSYYTPTADEVIILNDVYNGYFSEVFSFNI